MLLDCSYVKQTIFGLEEMQYYTQTPIQLIDIDTNIEEWFNNIKKVISNNIENFETSGSGWRLEDIHELLVSSNKCCEFSGSSYIELPESIQKKKAVINVHNYDNECFKWAVLSALYPVIKDPQRVNKYEKYTNTLNFSGINFPVDIKQIKKFEELNTSISINVYTLDERFDNKKKLMEQQVIPLRISKNIRNNHINLLLLSKPIKDNSNDSTLKDKICNTNVKTHYCWFKNLSRLVRSQNTKCGHKIFVCDRCLQYFQTEEKLNSHKDVCYKAKNSKLTMPNYTNKWISFNNYQNILEVPYIIYADLESMLQPIERNAAKNVYQKHIPFNIGLYLKCNFDHSQSFYKSKRDINCIKWFTDELYKIAINLEPILNRHLPMPVLTENEKLDFEITEICHICKGRIYDDEIKVRDHSHLTGKYRGPAHSNCNLGFKESRTIPVVFHNLNYDLHFLIEKITTSFAGNVNVIPINN